MSETSVKVPTTQGPHTDRAWCAALAHLVHFSLPECNMMGPPVECARCTAIARRILDALQSVGQLSTPESKETERDAARYRALRRGLIASVGEDGELLLSCDVALGGEFDDCAEPITKQRAPFLTDHERSNLNGSKPGGGTGYLRLDSVDRIVDHLVAAGAPAEVRS